MALGGGDRTKKHVGAAAAAAPAPQRRQRRSTSAVGTASSARQPAVLVVGSKAPVAAPSGAVGDRADANGDPERRAGGGVRGPSLGVAQEADAAAECRGETATDPTTVTIKTEPVCSELFDVNLNAMLQSADQSFEDFWQHFDDLGYADDIGIDEASSTTETASSSPDTTDSEAAASDDALLRDVIVAAAACAPSSSSSPMMSSVSSQYSVAAAAAASKRFDCTRCEKRFASAATLEKHLLVHDEIRPYRCAVCDIGFKLKVHLKKHNLYRHSEEYPCECSICGKRFKDSSAVRLHERIHSSDRPFQCLHCGKSFKTRENLWGHRNRGPCEKSLVGGGMAAPGTPDVDAARPASTTTTAVDATQRFVANNVRLFHSAEFGPILGVPVSATKLVLKEVRDVNAAMKPTWSTLSLSSSTTTMTTTISRPASGVPDAAGPRLPVLTIPVSAANGRMSAAGIRVSLSTASTTPATTSSIGLLPPRISAIRLGSAVTVGVQSMQGSVPTAVVTPIKREPTSDVPGVEHPVSGSLSNAVRPTSFVVLSKSAPSGAIEIRKRPRSASIADQCPTVQKYLAVGGPARSPDVVGSGGRFDRLLDVVPADMDGDFDRGDDIAENLSEAQTSLSDAISVLTESVMASRGTGASATGDDPLTAVGGDDDDRLITDAVDWPTVDGCADLGLGRDDADSWSDLMSASCDQLLTSTDDDDFSDDSFSDYQLLPSPLPVDLSLPSGALVATGGVGGTGKFDGGDLITPTTDAMWCDWSGTDSDLGNFLMLGP